MSEIYKLYLTIFKYIDEKILWTNRVFFIILLIFIFLSFFKFKNITNLFFVMLFSLTLIVNIVRFSPVMEDFSIDYNIVTTELNGAGFFSYNDFEGIKYITTPIGVKSTNKQGVNYLYIDEETIRQFSNNKIDWNFPNPTFVNSLAKLLKNFDNFTCEINEEHNEHFNIKITDTSNTYNYCFTKNE